MLKFLYTVLFVSLFSFTTQSQSLVVHQEWKVEAPAQWASFYWKVLKSPTTYNGHYYYYVYFYSNSVFNTKQNDGVNYDRAVTYIKGVTITMYEMKGKQNYGTVPIKVPFVLCGYDFNLKRYEFYFYSKSKTNVFKIKYNKIYPYEYYHGN